MSADVAAVAGSGLSSIFGFAALHLAAEVGFAMAGIPSPFAAVSAAFAPL